MPSDENYVKNAPSFGSLGLIPLKSIEELGNKVDKYLVGWRAKRDTNYDEILRQGYKLDSYIVEASVPRFGSGEAKGTLGQSIRGLDLFIMVDITNYSLTYSLCGHTNHMSPDDHYSDLKRIIAAVGGKARRITVIMPFLYESRQHRRSSRESLDCALALQELVSMGVTNIITFDAHDPRVQNAVPLMGIEMPKSAYKIISTLISKNPGLHINKDNMMIVSPDETAVSRAIFYSSMLELPLGMFYRDRDYTKVDDEGNHPIKSFRFLGDDPKGKDILIVDDMINSGNTMIRTATYMHERGAGNE